MVADQIEVSGAVFVPVRVKVHGSLCIGAIIQSAIAETVPLSPIVRQVEPPPRLLVIASKHAQIALGTFLAARYSSPAPPSENACAPLRRGGAMPPS